MVGFWTTWEEIQGIYNEVYQQKGLLHPTPYGPGWMEALDQEICASLEEWTLWRWGTTKLEEDLQGATVPILQPSHQTEFCHQTQGRNEESHDQALSEAREAYQRALEATHLLEQNIKRLSWPANRAKLAKCQCPYSHSHSRGRPQGRHALSQIPHRLRKHITFQDQEEETSSREGPLGEPWEQVTGGGEVEESNLGLPPTLGPELEHFPEMPTTTQGARDRQGSLPEPSIDNYEMWLEWWACQLDTPNWWEELTVIPNVGDPKKLAQQIHISFKIPGVKCEILGNHNCAPCAKMCQMGYVPAEQPALPRCPTEIPTEDPGLCTGPSILGREGQSACAW